MRSQSGLEAEAEFQRGHPLVLGQHLLSLNLPTQQTPAEGPQSPSSGDSCEGSWWGMDGIKRPPPVESPVLATLETSLIQAVKCHRA